MPLNLSHTLVVGISSTALFNLEEADRLFRELREEDPDKAIERYRDYMQKREDKPLEPGTGLPLVKALLQLNEHTPENEPPITEVVILSQNSPETGVRVLNSIRERDLDISRSAFTAGASVTDYLDAFDVDLFLTTDEEDAQTVIDTGECAAAVLSVPPDRTPIATDGEVRIALDGDAVLFSEESEIVYKTEGLEEFHEREAALEDEPLPGGPYEDFLKALAQMQERLPTRVEYSPVRLALVTSRDSPTELRVIKTLREWGVYVDLAFFLGGVDKGPVLEAFNPHI
jgi:5'-nucleotidase